MDIIRPESVSIHDNPTRSQSPRPRNRLLGIFRGSGLNGDPLVSNILLREPLVQCGNAFRRQKANSAAGVLPGLGQRQTAHHVPAADRAAGVGAE